MVSWGSPKPLFQVRILTALHLNQMINFGLLILLILWLGLIYLSRQHLTRQLFRLINAFGGGRRAFTAIWSIIFLPGTIIHEMSHVFTAAVTGTHVGKVEILPMLPRLARRDPAPQDNDERSVRLGSVQTQRLGLFREFLVGSAPFLVGLGLLMWISSTFKFLIFNLQFLIADLLKFYLFFTIANSLFLSWADFKHALPLVVIAVILEVALFAAGIQPVITQDSLILVILARLQTALLWSLGINIAATGIIWGVNKLL